MSCAAVILCGGRSSRMGVAKESLRSPSGKTLLEIQIDRLRVAGYEPLALAGDPTSPEINLPRWPDAEGIDGPLAAFPSILRKVTADHVLVLSVDLGAMSEELLVRLRGKARKDRILAPHDAEGRWESTCCLWPNPLLAEVTGFIDSGGRSIRGLLDLLRDRVDPFPIDSFDAPKFANWNAPADLPSDWRAPP